MSHKSDVMYETMKVYRFSWAFFLTFIFFTAFAFLNMVIGIVVSVLEDERAKENKIQEQDSGVVSLDTLHQQIMEIQELLKNQKNNTND